MPVRLKGLRIKRVSLVDSPANEEARLVLFKRKGADGPTEEDQPMDELKQMLATLTDGVKTLLAREETGALEKEISALSAQADELAKRLDALDAEPEPTPEEVEKAAIAALPEAMREKYQKALASEAEAVEKAKKAEDERAVAEHVEKAKGLNSAPAKAEELGALLKRVADGVSEEDFGELERVLKGMNEAARGGEIDKARGVGGADPNGDGSAESQLMAMAKVLVEKSEGKLDMVEALAKVSTDPENAETYRRYQLEKQRSLRRPATEEE